MANAQVDDLAQPSSGLADQREAHMAPPVSQTRAGNGNV